MSPWFWLWQAQFVVTLFVMWAWIRTTREAARLEAERDALWDEADGVNR